MQHFIDQEEGIQRNYLAEEKVLPTSSIPGKGVVLKGKGELLIDLIRLHKLTLHEIQSSSLYIYGITPRNRSSIPFFKEVFILQSS
jgi:hypothetical protein|tara:strand:- start:408 stop:665 length:258 start_codon:yes stop_codon:yes gene_type:complete